MAKNNNLTDFLTGVADAIRTKKGTTDLINPQDFESEIASISGGGEQPTGDYAVKVIEYDGTVLLETKGKTGDIITLPTAPTHDKLVFQEWSASVAVTNNTVTIEDNDVMVGAIYKTASGESEFDINLTAVTGLSVTLKMDGTKEWGDGTSDTATTHTYAAYGEYTIKCDGTTMNTSNNSGLFGQSNSAINYYCVRARLANVTTLGNFAFSNCYSLINITLPTGITNISQALFSNCRSLKSLVIPSSVTSIGTQAFMFCQVLTSLVIPSGVTGIGTQSFLSCYSLTNISLPKGATSIGGFANCYALPKIILPSSLLSINSQGLAYCNSLTSLIIPSSVRSIGAQAFQRCYSITKYDFSQHTSVPTLSDANAFQYINGICKIIVPDSLANEWVAATNWSTYADYIYKASEVQ